jgi:HK97 gp10 family phage protein
MIQTTVRVQYNRWPQLVATMVSNAEQEEKKAARKIVGYAIARCPVDTTRLKNSLTYKKVGDRWIVLIEDAFPAMGGTKPEEYGIYVEFGTRNMAAQPYFFPAVRKAKAEFVYGLQHNLFSGVR